MKKASPNSHSAVETRTSEANGAKHAVNNT